jgi:Fe2+ transport system protein FeoA
MIQPWLGYSSLFTDKKLISRSEGIFAWLVRRRVSRSLMYGPMATDRLRYLSSLRLVPGTEIEVREYSPFDHNLTVKVGRKIIVLGISITRKIHVRES